MVAFAETRAPQSGAPAASRATDDWLVAAKNRVGGNFSDIPVPRPADRLPSRQPCRENADAATTSTSGMLFFGFRYYHPQWGRFLNRDPIAEAGGVNLYRFVSNDPVNRWDLLGLDDYEDGILGIGAGMKDVAADLRSGDNSGVGGFFNHFAANLYEALGSALTLKDNVDAYNHSVDRIAAAGSVSEDSNVAVQLVTVAAATVSEATGTTNMVEAAAGVDVQGNELGGAERLQTAAIGVAKLAGTVGGARALADSATPSAPRNSPSSNYPEGSHTTFRTDQAGRVTHYETRVPQTNPQNPNPWQVEKRFDGTGRGHFNKATGSEVPTPHVHDSATPGGVRAPRPDELPAGS